VRQPGRWVQFAAVPRRSFNAFTALAVAGALSLGAGASLAQAQGGAGDDQYVDPFGGQQQGTTPSPKPRPTSGTPSTPPPVSNEPPAAPSAPPAPAPAPAPAASPGRQLPATGAEPGIVALFGAGFLLTGAGIRLRARGA
jgi:hypothetical protein